MQKEKKGKLPVFGVGPVYVIVCFLFTTTAVLLDQYGYLEKGKIPGAKIGMTLLGILFILGGLGLWIKAVLLQKIGEEIKRGKLITDGVYSLVRNPIYSAFLFVFTGILCLFYNLYLLLLPFLFWLFLTVLMRCTEEKWLKEKFGDEYTEYAKKVNRVIPWFRKK